MAAFAPIERFGVQRDHILAYIGQQADKFVEKHARAIHFKLFSEVTQR